MQLTKTAYYGDFVAYPIAVGLLAAAAARIDSSRLPWLMWMVSLIAGTVFWTLMEYLIHRWVLHRPGRLMAMHQAHHTSPRDFIGTPPWISMSVLFIAVGLPAWLWGGLNVASGLTAGVMLGYWWYGIVHHVIHHRTPTPLPGYFHARRVHHLHHHHARVGGNFGVTTLFWDILLRTRIDR